MTGHLIWRRLKAATGVLLLVAAAAACSSDPQNVRSTASPKPSGEELLRSLPDSPPPVERADLRPEAVALVNLDDPTDQLVLQMFAGEYQRASVVADKGVRRGRELVTPLASCLQADMALSPSVARDAAGSLLNTAVSFEGDGQKRVEIDPEARRKMTADDGSKATLQKADESTCRTQIDSVLGYVLGGVVNQRATGLKDSKQWVDPSPAATEELTAALKAHCPEVLSGEVQECNDLAGYLRAALPAHRSIITSNLPGLSR